MSDQGEGAAFGRDALFRQKRKKGTFRLVEPPVLEGALADTHAHVQMLSDPALALARAAVHGVDFVCDIVDVCEDDLSVLERMDGWRSEADALIPCLESLDDWSLQEAEAGSGATRLPAGADAASFAVAVDANDCHAPVVRFALGCHPHNAKLFDAAAEERLHALLADPRVCAVGEVGLDYHYDLSPRAVQREVFARQIRIAHEADLPLCLHVREAHDDAFALLEEEGFPAAGVLLHCFDLDWETLEPWLERGCYVALGGALTFGRCSDTRDAVAKTPLDRLLTETDSPYMTPEPMRGMECDPSHVAFTAARMAEVVGASSGEERRAFLAQIHDNALRFYAKEGAQWNRGF